MPSPLAAPLKSKILQDIKNSKNAQALKKAKLGVKKFPGDPDFWSMAGFVLQSEKQYKKSVQFFLGAVKLRPRDEKDIENLATALEMSNQTSTAEKYLRQTLNRHPDILQVYVLLGNLLARQERWHDLVRLATTSLEIFPEDVEFLTLRGSAYNHLNDYHLSFTDRNRAYELKPTHPMAARLFAQSLHQQGDKVDAKKILFEIVDLDPKNIDAIYDLSMMATPNEAVTLLAVIDQISEDDVQENDVLLYTRAHLIKASKNLKDALPLFAKANAARFANDPYDTNSENRIFSLTEQHFSTKTPVKITSDTGSRVPIFIVGQPRSGTTLLEMMLSSSEGIHGCGELDTVIQFCKNFQVKGHEFSISDAKELARHYFQNLPNVPIDSFAIVDKTPLNYQKLGYILSAIPNAKVVNILRDPRDTALSSWIQRFTERGMRHTNDLAAMAYSANLYRRYMNFWQTQFSSQILTIQYEQLTSEPEEVVRSIAKHCGIAWDPAMISPEKNNGIVKTASIDQVRSKISSNSVGNWQQAAEEMSTFIDGLDFDLWPEYEL